jgi:hypothetical protein
MLPSIFFYLTDTPHLLVAEKAPDQNLRKPDVIRFKINHFDFGCKYRFSLTNVSGNF